MFHCTIANSARVLSGRIGEHAKTNQIMPTYLRIERESILVLNVEWPGSTPLVTRLIGGGFIVATKIINQGV